MSSKKWSKGEIHPETGKAFWGYNKGFKDSEWWVPSSEFEDRLERARARSREHQRKLRSSEEGRSKQIAAAKKWRDKNKEKDSYKEKNRNRVSAWVKDNPEKKREQDKKWAAENPEKRRAIAKAEYQRNKHKKSAYQKRHDKEFPEKRNAISARYRARKRKLLHPDHSPEIESVLRSQAKRLESIFGVKFEVDHSIPISGGGFHHHLNLKVLPMKWNRVKSKGAWDSIPECWHPATI